MKMRPYTILSIEWKSSHDEQMMSTSQYIIVRPNDTVLYLATMAAMMSVPPVLPLWVNTTPKPRPHSTAPRMTFMNVCCSMMGVGNMGCSTPIMMVAIVAPMTVRSTNCLPTLRKAMASRMILMA